MKQRRGKRAHRVRLEDLAIDCGVSVSTVSRALTGQRGVRSEIRDRVIEAAKAANYAVPSTLAGRRVIVAASSAAMIDYARNQFTLHVLDGIRARALALGAEVSTQPVGTPDEERRLLDEAMAADDVAGILFLTLDDDEMLAATRNVGKPVVLVNGDDPLMRLSSVTPCNRSAAHIATDHLIGLGHRRILFLMRPGRRTIARRLEGFRDSFAIHGIPPEGQAVVEVDDWLPDLAARAIRDRVSSTGLDFTAVLAAGDSLAIGALMGLKQLGISVPGKVSVMGMDDLPQAAFLDPPLTTVHIPMRDIGSAALDLLRDAASGVPVLPRRIELACHVVERGSTGPAV